MPVLPHIRPEDLQHLLQQIFPATQHMFLGSWEYRYAQGLAGTHSSVRVDGYPDCSVGEALRLATRWYRSRGAIPRLQTLNPSVLDTTFSDAGWTVDYGGSILAIGTSDYVAATAAPKASGQAAAGNVTIMRTGAATYVAEMSVNGRVAGTAQFQILKNDDLEAPRIVAISVLRVNANMRRQGVAWSILHEIACTGLSNDTEMFVLHLLDDNDIATVLYATIGFERHHRYRYWVHSG